MQKAFFLETEVVGCRTIREKDNLAMSSRNRRLSEDGRKLASCFADIIRKKLPVEKLKEKLEQKNIEVDYLEEHFGRRFAAVYIEGIRLIDNIDLRELS